MKRNILIIDDNVKNIQLAANVLNKMEEYNIIFATSGEKGLEQLEKKDFALILLDINMPGLNGYETAAIIKQNELTKNIPIIFLSANTSQESIEKGFEYGGEDYITKPFHEKELVSRVQTHVDLYCYRHQLEKRVDESELLLKQYKEIMDLSTLVSKADVEGNITYANDKFCQISQFSREELIGQSHSIIRHENTKDEVFDDMWQTIKNKKVWKGTIENKARDGSSYFVKTTIMPILDSFGEIREYISVRTDITHLIELKQEIINTQKEILYTLGELGEVRSNETGHHVKRVSLYSELIAEKIGLDKEEIELLKTASPMHDIGKVAIPDEILLKPEKLTDNEMKVMKTHAEIGYKIFSKSTHKILQTAATISHEHHERYDGTGYPRGLKGEEISVYGRITAIADVFDALAHDRVYKKAWEIDEVIQFLINGKTKQFDPHLVDIFIENIDAIMKIKDEFND